MQKETKLGMNRTGIDMSPVDSKELIEGAARTVPTSQGGPEAFHENRKRYIREGFQLGSVPPPGTLKGAASTGLQMLAGKRPEVLINKLGERLAFERGGVRLYDALIAKCEEKQGEVGTPPLDRLRLFRQEELSHFETVRDAIRAIGADPTAQTPDADATAVSAMGWVQILTDPRTTVAQSLNAILCAELADNDGWDLLIRLTEDAGLTEISGKFRQCLEEEAIHLAETRSWLQSLVLSESEGKGAKAA